MKDTAVGRFFVLAVSVLILCGALATAQKVDLSEEKYITPPKELLDLVTAPRHLNITLNNLGPDRENFLITRTEGIPTLQQYAKPYVNLGETAFDYKANRARQFQIRRDSALELFNYKTGAKLEIAAPKGAWLSSPAWSPDGSKVAYFVHTEDATNLYVAGVKDGKSRKVSQGPILATLVTEIEWTSDSTGCLIVVPPAQRKAMPAVGQGGDAPEVRMSAGRGNANRTYRFLMHTQDDKDMLEWLGTGQLVLMDAATGSTKNIGAPDMWRNVDVSPDGKYFRATTVLKPFSYLVPLSEFGTLDAVYDFTGKKLADISKRELREGTVTRNAPPPTPGGGGFGGRGGRPDDKRNVIWRPDKQGLGYLQQEPRPRGEAGAAAPAADDPMQETPATAGAPKRKDRLMQWRPPFDDASLKQVYENEDRIDSVQYAQDCETLFLTETVSSERHLFAVRLSDPKTKHTIYKQKTSDRISDPGSLMTKCLFGCSGSGGGGRGAGGGITAARIGSDGQSIYLSGTQYSRNFDEKAPRPFINQVNFMSGEAKKIFESPEDVYETVSLALDDDLSAIITSRENDKTIHDSYLRDMKTGELKKLTSNVDYSPQITNAIKKRMQVERVDGVKFWLTITLPADYVSGTKLPALFWFYPAEFADQKAYDDSKGRTNKNAFARLGTRSMQYFIVRGYAVVEPDCPIVGPQGQMNNNYVADLRNSLWAVIDTLDKQGFIDRDRLAIGGHSYGAFSTANAMAHTPFFKAGIAGDGNYNRTLTPFTFQNERRWFWDARDVYTNMSPIFYANQVNGALLMYHGQEDANNGTDPINSDRLFQALNGLGKTTALYSYPYEDHGPAMKETLLDMWARWDAWLDKYVKNPVKPAPKKSPPAERPPT
jgi:dipeptidyl aminopeptidase/acylaminoacyl peptidase